MSLAVLADHMASKGRGPDSMLIHMSPREVQGLQALAMKNGGSLTINPETGLPEAGFLDKLLPAIIGIGISYFSGGAIDPKTAGMIVGGVQTARTGDIGKGISAGLGAYGGAGIGANMSAAGSSALGADANLLAAQQATELSGLESMSGAFGGAGATVGADAVGQVAADQAATGAVEAASPFEKMSRGFDAVKANPMNFANKENLKYLASAAAPIMAGASVQDKGPQTVTKPGMIRPSSFDPYSGTYISGNPYEAAPTRAAGGGLMGMNDGGYSPGQLDFAQRSEPVTRMAGGGVTDAQVVDWFKLNPGAKDTDIAAAMQQYGVNPEQVARATGTQDKQAEYENRYLTATNQNVLAAADKFGDLSTATQGGTGTAAIADWMDKSGINAQEYATALESRFGKPAAGSTTNPYTAQGIQALYDNASMVGNQADVINAASPIKDIHDTRNDKTWVDWMDKNGIDVSEAARSFGLSTEETQKRYDAAKKMPVKPVTARNPITGEVTPAGPRTTIELPTTPRTNTPPGVSNPVGGPNTPGDKTLNPDGSITVTPNIPGRPYGGFSGIKEVKDAYTAGGGSLGYTSPVPESIEDFNKKYNTQTGGSKQAFDYLMGKTPYSPTPYTPTGEIAKPYWESVGGAPVNSSKKMYIFDPATKKYQVNPDYAIPTYDKDGKKTYNLTNRDVSAYLAAKPSGSDFYEWAKTNNLSVEQIAAATGLPITEIQKLFSNGKPKDETPPTISTNDVVAGGGDKAGGLMKLAEGGISGDGNLNLHIPLDFGGGGGGFGGGFGGGTPLPMMGAFGGQNNTGTGGYGYADRPDESGGLYKGPMGITAGLDDSGMGSPEILARSQANDAERAAGSSMSPASKQQMLQALTASGYGKTWNDDFASPIKLASGGIANGQFDLGGYSDGGRLLRGPGDGVSDSIPATIGNKRPARLADGEFVVPARIVSELGNGSTEAGARKLYAMMDRVQAARRGSIGKGKVAKNSRADKHLPA